MIRTFSIDDFTMVVDKVSGWDIDDGYDGSYLNIYVIGVGWREYEFDTAEERDKVVQDLKQLLRMQEV